MNEEKVGKMPELPPLVTPRELLTILRASRSALRYMLADPDLGFPKPIRISARLLRWRRSELEDWIGTQLPAEKIYPFAGRERKEKEEGENG